MYRKGFLAGKQFRSIAPYSVVGDPALTIKTPGLSGANQLLHLIVPEHSHQKSTSRQKQFENEDKKPSDQEGRGVSTLEQTNRELSATENDFPNHIDDSSSDTNDESQEDPDLVRQKQIEEVKRSFQHPIRVKKSELPGLKQGEEDTSGKTISSSKKRERAEGLQEPSVTPSYSKKKIRHNFKFI